MPNGLCAPVSFSRSEHNVGKMRLTLVFLACALAQAKEDGPLQMRTLIRGDLQETSSFNTGIETRQIANPIRHHKEVFTASQVCVMEVEEMKTDTF